MTSETEPTEAYVWVWLPRATEPVVAGRLEKRGDILVFTYGRSYLARLERIPLYEPELPLRSGRIRPGAQMTVAGCIADAGPDAWGQRVVMHRHFGRVGRDSDPIQLGLVTYLLESGSDRIGALDFQASSTDYVPRNAGGTLEEMMTAAERLEAGEPFSPEVDAALLRGSSIGGARPKVILDGGEENWIAKFPSATDRYPVVKAEAVAMDLARRVGIDVAETQLIECLGREVLLVKRFDRTEVPGERRMIVSALTILGLDEMLARYATYHDLANEIRERFTAPRANLRELFTRITFNICVSNTDDHARNHAAFWDGTQLSLTPAYDICPQMRSGGEATQTMEIGPDWRFSQLAGCVEAAHFYGLSPAEAREIINNQLEIISSCWNDAADAARLTKAERAQMWGRQVMNRYALEGYAPAAR